MSRPSLPRTLLTARDYQKLMPPERANVRELEKVEQQAAQELLDLRI